MGVAPLRCTSVKFLSLRDSFRSLHFFSEVIALEGKSANQSILEMSVVTPSDYIRNRLGLEPKLDKIKKYVV